MYELKRTEKEIDEELNALSKQEESGDRFAIGAITMLNWLNGDENVRPSDY